jgi:hypothetical protein
LPAAYRRFLRTRLVPSGESLLLRDTRTWPVIEPAPEHSFQLGSPTSGWSEGAYTIDDPSFRRLIHSLGEDRWDRPSVFAAAGFAETADAVELGADLRRYSRAIGRATHRVLYRKPEILSACVADLYREWLRGEHGDAEDCVVETGGLLDPWRVLTSGVVPYWCESASRRAADAAEWWIAGSSRFESITVVPQPPGTVCDAHAPATQWRTMTNFAGRRPHLDRLAISRYPLLPLPTSHAAGSLAGADRSIGTPAPMSMAHALTGLRRSGGPLGMLVI